MFHHSHIAPFILVALHPEGVDRNKVGYLCGEPIQVALHPEGVDRNTE